MDSDYSGGVQTPGLPVHGASGSVEPGSHETPDRRPGEPADRRFAPPYGLNSFHG